MSAFPDDLTLARADDAHLRRLAARHGLILRKSRWRHGSIDNLGGYMLVDPETNGAVAGVCFDLTGAEAAAIIGDAAMNNAGPYQRGRRT